jgi:hypothetical protein
MFALIYVHRTELFTANSWIGLTVLASTLLVLLLITPQLAAAFRRANWQRWTTALVIAVALAAATVGAVEYVVLPAPCHELPWWLRILFPECW